MGGMGGFPMPGMPPGAGGGARGGGQQPLRKAEPVEYNFNVTLEDLYHGGA